MESLALSPQIAKALSSFSAVLEGEEFRRRLDRLFPSGGGPRSPEEVRLRMIRAHKNRATFDLAIRAAAGWERVIAKIYASCNPDVFMDVQTVMNAGFGRTAEFSVPRPIAYIASCHVFLQERIWGTPAHEAFVKGNPEGRRETARRSGAWLARFHETVPPFRRQTSLHKLMALGQLWVDQISYAGEPLGLKAAELLRRLQVRRPEDSALRPCAGHGSYIPDHVFLTGRRTTVIDLDECDRADPARDLAVFVVALQRLGLKHQGSLASQDRAVEAFLERYARQRPAAMDHLPFYRAYECLHKAWRDMCGRLLPIRPWVETMLDEGLRLI